MTKSKRASAVIFYLFLAVVVASGCGERKPESSAPESTLSSDSRYEPVPIGRLIPVEPTPVPEFERLTLDGSVLRDGDLKGKVVVVNFWATWCAPCVKEVPELSALHTELRDTGLVVVGVSLDHEGFDAVQPFAERFQIPYPLVLDERLSDDFGGLYGLPVSFLIDRRGMIVGRINGIARIDTLSAVIRELLES